MPGQLFTTYFLEEGIHHTDAWQEALSQPAELESFRAQALALLDALYFHLYGLARDDVDYILDTFPIVRRHDEAEFGGYRTKEMVLAYYNAPDAGDTDVDVAV